MVHKFFLAQEGANKLADRVCGLWSNILDIAEVLARECSLSSLHSLELHDFWSNVLAFQLHKFFLNFKFSVFLFLLPVKSALFSQLLSDVLSINEFLLFLSLENCLVDSSNYTDLINFIIGNCSAVFSFLYKNIKFSFNLVLLLL